MSDVLDLSFVKEYLDKLDSAREVLIKRSRELTQMSKRVISYCLRGQMDNAYEELTRLSKAYEELISALSDSAELQHSQLLYSVVAEYVEALTFFEVLRNGKLPSVGEVKTHVIPYVLGLADLIGELKRYSLELVRLGKYDESMKYLKLSEGIYESLTSLTYPDVILPGLRRKLDIYRKVIDDWKEFLLDLISRKELKDLLRKHYGSVNEL